MNIDILDDRMSLGNNDEFIYDLHSPNTPLDSPPDSVLIDMKDSINFDLPEENDELFNSLARIPSFLKNEMPNFMYNTESIYYTQLETRPRMNTPYFRLEMLACFCLSVSLTINDFTFALVEFRGDAVSDKIIRYIVPKAINKTTLGLISFVFSNSETYKSSSVAFEYLLVNSIIYEYNLKDTLKYVFIQIVFNVLGCFLTIGMYYDLLKPIPSNIILGVIFSPKRKYTLNYSYLLVSVLMHSILALGIAILANMTTSTNSKTRAIQKSALIFCVSLSFGIVMGPVGSTLHDIILYLAIVIVRNDYAALNYRIVVMYSATILSTFVIYPLLTIRYKYYWLNSYKRYIEYKR